MNKQCPNCASLDIYRRHPHSLEVGCDNCHHRWQAKQVLAPILRDKFWLSKPLKGWHYVEVWRSSSNHKKFAYRLAYSASLFGELKGEFDTPRFALEAGIQEAKGLLAPANSPI
ncbi:MULTISPECIES: hypothetical protein [unclassified Microcoleus]|uniref:hypothetical protein n=1 Tax=unclassified Microcoleus TaxID=2642155 RepID=UPI002FD174D0